MSDSTLGAALALAKLLPGRLLPCAPNAKTPNLPDWTRAATTDPATLEEWFAHGAANMGWTPAAGLLVLDIDLAGFASLEAIEAEHGPMPPTLCASTPSGGRHHIFRLPAAVEASNRAGRPGTPFAGLDIRAPDRGFIVVSPSSTPAGAYRWIDWHPEDGEVPNLADAPDWLVRYAVEGQPQAQREAVATAGPILQGSRNDLLFREASRMRRHSLGEAAILAHLLEVNASRCDPPLTDKEVQTIAGSATRYAPGYQVEMPDTWEARLELADGASAVSDIVRALAQDEGLDDLEREALLKLAAKRAGVPIRAVRAIAAEAMCERVADQRTAVDLAPGRLHEAVNACSAVLDRLPLRVWGGRLVELTESGRLIEIERPRLATLLSSVVRFVAGDKVADAPRDLLDAVLALPAWPGVPEIEMLHRQPCAAGDNPVTQPGHSQGVEAIFRPGDYPEHRSAVIDQGGGRLRFGADKWATEAAAPPSACSAMAQLRWLLSGFEFESALDEVCALGMLLTAVARPGLPTAPAFIITADQPGAGKSHLARIAATLASGAPPADLTWKRGRERDDVLESALLQAPPVVLYDNCERGSVVYSDLLAKLLTSERVGVRQKGYSVIREVSTRSLIVFTGNAISIRSDMNRRTLTIRLKPHMRRDQLAASGAPADPLRLVREDRAKWVQTVNKVLADDGQDFYREADQWPPCVFKRDVDALDSFEDWHHAVRRVFYRHGLPDPVASIERAHCEDEEQAQLAAFAEAWVAVFADEGVTLATAWDHVAGNLNAEAAALRHAMTDLAPTSNGGCDVRRLGYALRGHERFGAWRLAPQVSGHKGGGRRFKFEPPE